MILFLLACPPKPTEVLVIEPKPEVISEPAAGTLSAGRFTDGRHEFEIAIPAGWQAEVWPDSGPLRVSLEHAETGARVEAWAFEHRLSAPAPRGNCTWRFIDAGIYREVLRPRLVASCSPTDPKQPRISAYILDQGAMTWQLELHVPVERLSAGRKAGEAVLQTVTL